MPKVLPQSHSRCHAAIGLRLFMGGLLVASHVSMPGASQAELLPENKGPVIVCQDEQLTVKATSVPLEQLLDAISKTCNLRIFTPSKNKTSRSVNVDIDGQQLEPALANLLKGCNYLIVFNENPENVGIVATSADRPSERKEAQATASFHDEAPYVVLSEEEEQVEFIRQEIAILKDRIESGVSDRMHEIAIKTKPAEFVQDDRQLLASYEERLATLSNEL